MQKKEKSSAVNCGTNLFLYRKDAEWLKKAELELGNVTIHDDVEITKEDVIIQLRKMPNWNAPRFDRIQGFWLKKFTDQHQRLIYSEGFCKG